MWMFFPKITSIKIIKAAKFKLIHLQSSPASFVRAMAEAVSVANIENSEKKGGSKKADKYKSRYENMRKRKGWVDFSNRKNEEKRICVNPEDRVKRRKCCMLLGYSGVNYFGMQRNPDTKTIEEDLLVAMLKNKWITDEGFKMAQIIQFQRAARTDKGVSAARQCVSLKIPEEVDLEKLNNDLPEQIRVFSIKRVTKGFNSKDKCDARTYTYTLPTVALANYDENVQMETYRVTDEKLIQLQDILKMYEGTKSFHNFTSRKEYLDPSSKRYIISFDCGRPFVPKITLDSDLSFTNTIEFIVLKVKGQSFMLHQIRKMVGLALAVMRNLTTIETIRRSFTELRLDLPMAPGLGLVLDQVHYDRYNQRYGADGMHDALTWDAEEEIIQKFIDEYIFPNIVNEERLEKPMVSWLETLPMHSYDVRAVDKPIMENGVSHSNEDEQSSSDDDGKMIGKFVETTSEDNHSQDDIEKSKSLSQNL